MTEEKELIIVDIYVPDQDKTYNFKLNEHERIATLQEEIAEMIGEKEQSKVEGNIRESMLCQQSNRRILDPYETLNSMGIRTGDKLIFI